MKPRTFHKVGRLLSLLLTVAGAAIGSLAGLGASEWGGLFVILPVTTAVFTLAGAALGGLIQFGIAMKWPED